MATTLLPKIVLATVAGVGMFLPFGAPLPGLCLRTIGVADAAPPPSPSCAGDLRECLRLSADLHQTTFGGRYVTADDVARCVEAFQACVSGSGSHDHSSSTPPPSPSGGPESRGLPQRFNVTIQGIVSECRVDGDTVNCAGDWVTGSDSYTSRLTGTLDGLTLSAEQSVRRSGSAPDDPACLVEETYSGPITFVFDPSGNAEFTAGPNQRQSTFSGSCTGSNSGTTAVMAGTARWSAIR